jgi:hypothetical protein
MPKRKLAIILASSMGVVLAVNLSLALGLALEHRPFAMVLASLSACIPGCVVAVLAWQGRLPSKCAASR